MTATYYGTTGFARRIGLSPKTVSAYRSEGRLPKPDVIVEEAGTQTWGWTLETIDKWQEERPKRPGPRPIIRWIKDTVNGNILILNYTVCVEDIEMWLVGRVPDPLTTGQRIHQGQYEDLPAGIEVQSAEQIAPPSSVTHTELYDIAAQSGVTSIGVLPKVVATVLANARPKEYGELILSHMG